MSEQANDYGVAPPEWWVDFYDDYLADTLLVRDSAADVDATLDFLCRALCVDPSGGGTPRLLDQCCGIGSLAVPLAARGFGVVAVDQSRAYVARMEASAGASGVQLEMHARDAFQFVADPPCQGGFNWWTSYGYAPSRDENREMLRRAFESLVPGARFALDTMNLPGVLRNFDPDHTTVRESAGGTMRMRRESTMDLVAGRLKKRWTYALDGKVVAQYDTSVMLSMPHELREDFEAAGFRVESIFGGLDARALTLNDERCIVIGQRPTSTG